MKTLDAQIVISAVDRASGVFKAVGRNAGSLEAALHRAGGRMIGTGAALTAGLTVPLAAFGVKAVRAAAAFEKQTIELRKEMDDLSPAAFEKISAALREIPKDTGATLDQVFAVATQAKEFGIAATEIQAFTAAAVNAGLAFGISAEEAGTQLATISKAYGIGAAGAIAAADSVQFYADQLNAGEKDVLAFTAAMGPAARTIGVQADAVAALGAAYASQGVDLGTAQAATAKLFKVLGTDKGLKAAAKAAGMSGKAFKAAFAEDSFGAIMAVVGGIARLETAQQQQAALAAIVGDRQAAALMPLIRAHEQLAAAQEKAAQGAAAGAVSSKTAAELASYNRQVEIMARTWEDLEITVGEKFIPVITPKLQAFSDFIKTWTAGPEGAARIDWAVTLGLTAAAAGPVIFVAGAMTRALTSMAVAVKGLGALAGTGFAGAAALAAIAVAGGLAAWQAWPEIADNLGRAAANAGNAATEFGNLLDAVSKADWSAALAALKGFAADSKAVLADLTAAYEAWARSFTAVIGLDSLAKWLQSKGWTMAEVTAALLNPASAGKKVVESQLGGSGEQRAASGPAESSVVGTKQIPGVMGPSIPEPDVFPRMPSWWPQTRPHTLFSWGSDVIGTKQIPGVMGPADPIGRDLRGLQEGIKIEAPEMKGKADVNVHVRVEGPGRVTAITATASGNIQVGNTGADHVGAPRLGTERF